MSIEFFEAWWVWGIEGSDFSDMCLVTFVVDFWWESCCILWVSGSVVPSDRIGNFVVEVVLGERICVLSVSHECSVV